MCLNMAGASQRHEFGIVQKVTPTGRYRIQPIGYHTHEETSNRYQSYTRITPDPENVLGKSVLVRANGECYVDGYCRGMYVRYFENEPVSNYYDFGD